MWWGFRLGVDGIVHETSYVIIITLPVLFCIFNPYLLLYFLYFKLCFYTCVKRLVIIFNDGRRYINVLLLLLLKQLYHHSVINHH